MVRIDCLCFFGFIVFSFFYNWYVRFNEGYLFISKSVKFFFEISYEVMSNKLEK